jgi:hypothetical protein
MRRKYRLHLALLFAALIGLAVGGWIVNGTRKLLSPA